MFDNIGGKIKSLAKVLCILGIIASVIGGIVEIANSAVLPGILTAILGALFAWIGSFGLYGLGQLIENSDAQTYRLEAIEKKLDRIENK